MTSSRVRKCEVLITGGGPAGLVLACLLAMDGVDVVVLERRNQPRTHSRAIGLHPPALAVLNRIGLESSALTQGTRVHAGTAYSRGRRLGTLSFEEAWPHRPFVLTLPQNRTEALLSQRLKQLAPGGITIRLGNRGFHRNTEPRRASRFAHSRHRSFHSLRSV